ncbi:MAG: DUF4145 domain-containing protein [Pseudomonadota bacterium]
MEEIKEKFFCNKCKTVTKHFIRGEHTKTEEDKKYPIYLITRLLIIECCGCENHALAKKTFLSEDVYLDYCPKTGKTIEVQNWDEVIYPPVSYRKTPLWLKKLEDRTLIDILTETYNALSLKSNYLATFGSRTAIDRLIFIMVGDKGCFKKGLEALKHNGKISVDELQILEPIIEAGNAAAHRGWRPSDEELSIILDTAEGLIHRLLILPEETKRLEENIPKRSTYNKYL